MTAKKKVKKSLVRKKPIKAGEYKCVIVLAPSHKLPAAPVPKVSWWKFWA